MIDIKQQQKVAQQQQLSSRQLQSLSLLSVPVLELQEKINEAMNSNPLLEYESFPDSALLRELPDVSIEDERKNMRDDDDDVYSGGGDSWQDDLPIPDGIQQFSPEQQSKRDYFFSNITEHESMQQLLLQEVGFLDLADNEQEIAEAVVGAIDDSGFLSTPLADIAQCTNAEIFEVEAILGKLQKIFSPGIGARDLKECLKLQLEAQNESDPDVYRLLDYLEEFGNNKIEYLSDILGIPVARLNELGDRIRSLNPYPGNVFNHSRAEFIAPEATVVFENGRYIVREHDEFLPRIKISEQYAKMLEDKELPAETLAYLQKKMQEAELFRNSLLMREKTIVRIAAFITENQQEFFADGIESLRPMTMAQAAEALEIHETTVSRGCAGKYLATPQGLLEFRFFFSGGFQNADGADVSVHAIQQKIREFIEDEEPHKPLSDDKIAKLLENEGFKIARRTIAKYREQMNIPPTNLRRKH
ncbi:MAG: RNA polymerase factor sigma-54 [Lentisphaeria bacterium]|nr:RNA polymerase factor sigma-54 [Lentisphaeria bacterium]